MSLSVLRLRLRATAAACCAASATATAAAAVMVSQCEEKKEEKPVKYEDSFAPGTKTFPTLEYGKWVSNWDARAPPKDAPEDLKKRLSKAPTRHIILIRHGQYDLDSDVDPPLTQLGRVQAELTGLRLAKWGTSTFQSNPKDKPKPIKIRNIYSSDVARARETAEIIAEQLPDAKLHAADPMLAEGAPCPVPNWQPYPSQLFEDGARIEAAFRRYIHRSVDGWRANKKEKQAAERQKKKDAETERQGYTQATGEGTGVGGEAGDTPNPAKPSPKSYADEDGENDQYDVIVCHGNVIRYFTCRALQLPPEGWLKLATFNCGMTHLAIRSHGSVSLW